MHRAFAGRPLTLVGVERLDRRQFLPLSARAQPGEQGLVYGVVATGVVDVLVGADACGVALGELAGEPQAEGASVGVTEQYDLVDGQAT
ncbi:hypothetical protein LG634_19640 [Streptomyces bambusae]|uniref:hypothetical protein n=1 Tax=Streptomyces bambusae TaxID=1550616 RepID=UPI001CFD166C|nr:hypothetical protein [Streptomyces bambusae]MCB5167042.1 hypothetical protein [Streptomyces bambusae]